MVEALEDLNNQVFMQNALEILSFMEHHELMEMQGVNRYLYNDAVGQV